MIERVLDASVLVKWFTHTAEQHSEAARALMERYERGELVISAPPLLFVEMLNVAARRWRWEAPHLSELAEQMDAYGFHVQQPSLAGLARWTGRGLTAYDASYVALAEERRTVVVTADDQILAVAGPLAESVAAFALARRAPPAQPPPPGAGQA